MGERLAKQLYDYPLESSCLSVSGLTMEHDEVRERCHYFHFEHSPVYQKIQLRFWEAVDTFDPNSIAVSSSKT